MKISFKKKKEEETFDFKEEVRGVIRHLFGSYKANSNIFSLATSVEEYSLYKTILSQYDASQVDHLNKANGTSGEVESKKTGDEVFSAYIIEFYPQSDKEYFFFLTKFVTLFRECVNRYRSSNEPGKEFTQINGAEGIPDLCNEFITDFMENNDNFGLDTNELIEIIQHFCNWLYENKYTTSRLTLIS